MMLYRVFSVISNTWGQDNGQLYGLPRPTTSTARAIFCFIYMYVPMLSSTRGQFSQETLQHNEPPELAPQVAHS